jgi:two-component system sensor histidine kinase PhoQ
MLLLLATLAALLHWVLGPVRRMEREIHEVEEGRRERLGGGYPRELAGVAGNLNALLIGERKRVARYRDTLGNLAHSLKTPLAVMRAEGANAMVSTEIDRMSGIIEHQLKRAAASGGALLGQAPVEVSQVAAELRATLLRVYARKDLAIELAVAPAAQFVGDRGDLTELLGNLLDNACKWCRARVRFSATTDDSVESRERLCLMVEDDGAGISAADRARVLQRGVRADEKVPGHGLGLAMVHDTVDLYGGRLSIEASPLASEPDSRPPPVSFSPPNAPPISAPEVPRLTLAMPQSLPAEERKASAFCRRSVNSADDSPWAEAFCCAIASLNESTGIT